MKNKEESIIVVCINTHPYKWCKYYAGQKYEAIRTTYKIDGSKKYIITDTDGKTYSFHHNARSKEGCFTIYFEELSVNRKRKIEWILRDLD